MKQINLARFDLNLLVLLEVLLEERHVGRSASRLSLTPSAVSHRLGRLRLLLNDPLLMRTPKGVVPTDRALALAKPVADILAQVRSVVASSDAFDPATATREFKVGTTDYTTTVLLAPLVRLLEQEAPGVRLLVRGISRHSIASGLDARAYDCCVAPLDDSPDRLASTALYDDGFVTLVRAGHASLDAAWTLDAYCARGHVLVSPGGDSRGWVDEALAEMDRTRHVGLTVPTFLSAFLVVAETDLIVTIPARLAETQAARFGLVQRPCPVDMPMFTVKLISLKSARHDAGLKWLAAKLRQVASASSTSI
jgi:DNA-binding transcriptional LysR family regulator